MLSREFFYIAADGGRFIRFSNSDGKRWIMPLRDMRTAMNLYQPSGIKGRLVKRLLPYLYQFPLINSLIHSEIVRVKIDSKIWVKIKKVLNTDDFQFAIFEGTPSVHKKATVQIWQKSKILAYCKVSDSDEVGVLFERESHILSNLHSAGINPIPQSLSYEKTDGFHLFIQSTVKTKHSNTVHRWRQQHWDFLALLHERTKCKCRFEDSDLAKSIVSLEGCLDNLPQEDATIIKQAIDVVWTYYQGREVEFSAYHGDFTPWNIFFERDNIFVFDFEYAGYSCPPYMDMFHFINQVAIIERQYSAIKIYEYFLEEIAQCNYVIKNFTVDYLSYLLYIISFYYRIGNRDFGPNDNGYCQWLSVINIVVKQNKK